VTTSFDRARAYRLFAEAADLPAAERERFLEAACDGNGWLRAEVDAYLSTAAQDPLLTTSLSGVSAAAEESMVGRTVGRFRLSERIGAGGMGVVYRAERIDGVPQAVAVKVVAGTLAAATRERFTHEAQLLARLEHPSIARLIDVGTEGEHAWIAMEFVRGERIDAYCSSRALGARDIVRLLVPLADAIAAAHAMLVVHSDIKPANVLVTADGTPKLIDFGISSVLRGDGGVAAPARGPERQFSPHYAAPEQVRGGLVSAATDVFGLGALAYRLLTGRPVHADAGSALSYMLAVVERDVGPPSTAVAAHDARALRGDLDAILGKALARDPAQRYASAAEMAAELRRYLERRPVLARPPALGYRLGRFVQRNGIAVTLAALLGLSLVAGVLFTLSEAHRAELARDEARTVTAFLTNDILAAANPMVAGTRDVQLRPLLDHATGVLEQRFAAQPAVLAELESAMGSGYAALYDGHRAEALLTAAERGLSREFGDSDAETERARLALWYLYTGFIDLPKLYALSARIAAAENAAARPHSAMAERANLMLAWIPCVAKAAAVIGLSDCGGLVGRFYADARAHLGPNDIATYEMQWFLGVALSYSSRENEAVPVLREACAGLERYYGPVHHRLTACRRFLARALDANGEPAAAEPLLETVVHNFSVTLGPDSRFAAISNYELASAALHAGHAAAAVAAAERAVHGMREPGCDCEDDLLRSELRLAGAQSRLGQTAAALAAGEQALARAVHDLGAGAAPVLQIRAMLADVYLDAGDAVRAEALDRENLARAAALPNRPEWFVGECEAELAGALAAQRRAAAALPLLDDAIGKLSRGLGADNPRTRAAVAARDHAAPAAAAAPALTG
jgi:serine/threonine-protein kinase